MRQTGVYQLHAPILAVYAVEDDWGYTRVLPVQIPAGERVAVISDQTPGSHEPFTAAEWRGKVVFLFAVDLQHRGEPVCDFAPRTPAAA
jgi:hypothetical protein